MKIATLLKTPDAISFNPFEYPAILNELQHIFQRLDKSASRQKGEMFISYLQNNTLPLFQPKSFPGMSKALVGITPPTHEIEALFDIEKDNKPFCVDLEAYITSWLK
jgi:hypothetical protein